MPQIAIENGVHYSDCLDYVREARNRGLQAPVILMGDFNLSYRMLPESLMLLLLLLRVYEPADRIWRGKGGRRCQEGGSKRVHPR